MNNPTALVDVFDLDAGVWSTTVLSTARSTLTAVAVKSKVLFAGGERPGDTTGGWWTFTTLSQTHGAQVLR